MKSMVEFVKKRQDISYGTFDIDASTIDDYPQVLKDAATSYSSKYLLRILSVNVLHTIKNLSHFYRFL
jgi:hypothetical protein